MISPKYDFHIHTKYLGCANATMEVPDIAKECARLGVQYMGISDHLNSLDKLELHLPIRRDIENLQTTVQVYFGVELNFTGCDQSFAFSREIKEKYDFQFAIGGIHSTYLEQYDPAKMVDIQHRHHLVTCRDPLVDVLVHPYWFPRSEFNRPGWSWFDTMKLVPKQYVRELGQTARQTGTAIEINGSAILKNTDYGREFQEEYFDFLSALAEEGATFSVGSDAHDLGHLAAIQDCWRMVERLHLTPDRIWKPQGIPVVGHPLPK